MGRSGSTPRGGSHELLPQSGRRGTDSRGRPKNARRGRSRQSRSAAIVTETAPGETVAIHREPPRFLSEPLDLGWPRPTTRARPRILSVPLPVLHAEGPDSCPPKSRLNRKRVAPPCAPARSRPLVDSEFRRGTFRQICCQVRRGHPRQRLWPAASGIRWRGTFGSVVCGAGGRLHLGGP